MHFICAAVLLSFFLTFHGPKTAAEKHQQFHDIISDVINKVNPDWLMSPFTHPLQHFTVTLTFHVLWSQHECTGS